MEPLIEEVLQEYAGIAYVPLRLAALSHTIRVMDVMALICPGESGQLAACLHDYARFMKNAGHRHAVLSASYAKERLCSHPDCEAICTAIANHSAKQAVHDPFSEALKDADVLARWLEDADYVHPRLDTMKKKGLIPSKLL